MNKIVKFFILIIICTKHTAYAEQSLISKLYCSFLGNKDTQTKYTEKVKTALKDLGLENPSDVAIKQMNKIGPIFANIDLASFTAFGIWLNEEYFDKCNDKEQLFHIYHEASHYIQKHHQKLLVGCSIALAIFILALRQINNTLGSTNPIIKNTSVATIGILTIFACYRYLLPYIIKRQEKQADISAADALITAGHQDIVDAHIKHLEGLSNPGEKDLWWHTVTEQIKYLKKSISKQKPQTKIT